MSLTKTARLQERIRTALRETPIRGYMALNIFAPEPEAEVEREAARLRRSVDLIGRLLSILAEVRTTVGKANAKSGIAQLLAEKSAIEEELSIVARLLPSEETSGSDDGLEIWRRPAQRASFRRRAGEVEEEIRAMRTPPAITSAARSPSRCCKCSRRSLARWSNPARPGLSAGEMLIGIVPVASGDRLPQHREVGGVTHKVSAGLSIIGRKCFRVTEVGPFAQFVRAVRVVAQVFPCEE